MAIDKANIVKEFQIRQKEAMENKKKVEGVVLDRDKVTEYKHSWIVQPAPSKNNKAEQEYLARLKAIRRQNYFERRRIKEQINYPVEYQVKPPSMLEGYDNQQKPTTIFDIESRRKKIAALKAQTEHEAVRIREKVVKKQRIREDMLIDDKSQVTIEEHITSPRKKWEVLPMKPVLAVTDKEQTGVISEETQSVVTFEQKPMSYVADVKQPRAAWENCEIQSINIKPPLEIINQVSLNAEETVVIFGKINDDDQKVESGITSEKPLSVQKTVLISDQIKKQEEISHVTKDCHSSHETKIVLQCQEDDVSQESTAVNNGSISEHFSKKPLLLKPEKTMVVRNAWVNESKIGVRTTSLEDLENNPMSEVQQQPQIEVCIHENNPLQNDVKDHVDEKIKTKQAKSFSADRIYHLLQNKLSSLELKQDVTPEVDKKKQEIMKQNNDDIILLEYEAELENRELEYNKSSGEEGELSEEESYFTASNKSVETSNILLASINHGAFDEPNVKVLRTCSLPDLRSIVENSSSSTLLIDDNNCNQIPDQYNSVDSDSCSSEFSSNDDEHEIQDLLSTLQRVYNEVCSPTKSRSSTPGEDVEVPNEIKTTDITANVENWAESDEEEDDDDKECVVKEFEEVFNRLEETRSTLEDVMGMQKLMEAYTVIQDFQEQDERIEDENSFPLEQLTSLLGTEHSNHFPMLIHLAVADLAYMNNNIIEKSIIINDCV